MNHVTVSAPKPFAADPSTTSPATSTSDQHFDVVDCLARVRTDDPEAARSLVRFLYPTVIGIVRRRLPRRAAEEDLAQEIFVKVFEKLDQYKGQVPIIHWVSRIAVNHCLNAIRSQKLRPEWRMADLSEEQQAALEPGRMAVEQPHPSQPMGTKEMLERILGTLSPKDSAILRMLELEELSIANIRELTGWSCAYIRLRAFRARRRLNKRFGRFKK